MILGGNCDGIFGKLGGEIKICDLKPKLGGAVVIMGVLTFD